MAIVGLLIAILAVGWSGDWHSYTNTNFINDIWGNDSTLFLATNGGLVQVGLPEPSVERTYVNTDGLPANRCLVVATDSEENLWVGTDGGGLAVLAADSTRAVAYRPDDLPDKVTALLVAGDHVLLGTDQGLYHVETRGTPLDFDDDRIRRFSVTSIRELLSDQILSLGAFDGYWIGTNHGVTSVDTGFVTWTGYLRPLGDSVKAMAVWQDTFVLATEMGVAAFRDSGFSPVVEFPGPLGVFDLVADGRDLYVGTDTGLYRGHGSDSTSFELILLGDVRSLRVDEVIWAGLGGNELSGHGLRYSRTGQSWSEFYSGCIASAYVSDVAFNPSDGRVHICHYLSAWGHTTVVPDEDLLVVRGSVLPAAIQVSCDSRGMVWFAHFAGDGGLSAYDPGADTWGKVQWGGVSSWNIIDAFAIDQYDTKWVFNGGGVVVAVDSAGRQTEFDVPGLVPPPGGGYDFAFDSERRAWLGLTVGLVELDYSGTLHDPSDDTYRILTGMPSSEVRSVAVDGQDHVWAATPQGAAAWDGEQFSVYTSANSGLLSNNVYRVRVDASDRVWFLCDGGLSVFDQVSGRWANHTSQGSGLIGNPAGIAGFYTALEIDRQRGLAAVGTQRGLSILDFGAAGDTAVAEHLAVFPNPCILGVHEWVVVDSLPDEAKVEVRTLEGLRVAALSVDEGMRRAVWRPEGVASGVYLLVVSCPQGTRIERLALVGE